MTQELEIVFFSYSETVKKYKIEDLQKGYELEAGPLSKIPSVGEDTAKEGIERSETIQKKTKTVDKAVWGLFKQKRILKLIMALESWNNKLMNLLLCGIYFLDKPDAWIVEDKETV